jgi:DNA-binding transcriptional MerR regulator
MIALMSIGRVAEMVNRSPALLRKLEADGVLPEPLRIAGSDRRVYRPEDVAMIRQALDARSLRRRGVAVLPEEGGEDDAA